MFTCPMRRACACIVLLAATVPSLAAPPAVPDQAESPVPALEYSSTFLGYASFRQTELADWRGVNDAAGALGGHMGHMPPSAPPTNHDHAGHEGGHAP